MSEREVVFSSRVVTNETITEYMPDDIPLRRAIVRVVRNLARRDDLGRLLRVEVDGTVVAWLGAPSKVPTGAHPKAVLFGQRIRAHLDQRLPPNIRGERLLPDGVPEMTEDDFT